MQCPLPAGQAPPAPRSASSPAPVVSAAADHIGTNGCDYTVPLGQPEKVSELDPLDPSILFTTANWFSCSVTLFGSDLFKIREETFCNLDNTIFE